MRLRTKLFIVWTTLVLLLCAGTWRPVEHTIQSSFARVAAEGFAGTQRSLHALQAEQISRMRQAGGMMMNIPELRALIAEHNFEISSDNLTSLQERLDDLSKLVGVRFICVLDATGKVIAQNHESPWPTLAALEDYRTRSPQAGALVRQLFSGSGHRAQGSESYGLWPYAQRLYQVVGVPLVFNSSDDLGSSAADGAMIMADPFSDALACTLGESHNCEVTFFAGDTIVASSLPASARKELAQFVHLTAGRSTDVSNRVLGQTNYRISMEPMLDPDSGSTVGAMLIQRSQADSQAAQSEISRSLFLILGSGVMIAGLASFFFSVAVTKPVERLVSAVQRVAQGELELAIPVDRRDELGKLSAAFNDMVNQLRSRRELERQVEESRAVSRAKSQFLANMSHEIRTPLNGVIGMAELLLRTPLNTRQQRFAGMVKSSAQMLTVLINDLLDLSKIEAGKLELESVAFDLHSIISEALELLSLKAFEKGLELVCHIDRDVPVNVKGDPTRLRQIVINLVNNAIKFTETGEIVVRVARKNADENDRITFSVIDTGMGVPKDRIHRLFKPFSQVDASTTRRFGGTGLGLAVCKQLSELMGGNISVQSEAGRGSTFQFSVKLSEAPGDPPGALLPEELTGMRVLVIDDNRTSREVSCQQLQDRGMRPQGTSGSEQAMEILRGAAAIHDPIQIVLVDDGLPGIRGRDLAPILRARTELGRPFFVLMLSFGADAELGASSMIDGFVTKPVSQRQLVQTLVNLKCLAASASTRAGAPAVESAKSLPASNGFRILLAEDNEVNQMVASELLEEAGYTYRIVSNGKDAVEAQNATPFDLILMDCQMPQLDGLEATRAIRAEERLSTGKAPASLRVPIIALTASASGTDRSKCLAAGMDGYCSKPFNAAALLEAIRSMLPAEGQPVGGNSKSPTAIDAPPVIPTPGPIPTSDFTLPLQAPPFDLGILLKHCSGKTALATLVLEKFEKQVTAAVTELEHSVGVGDADKIARTSHFLKGSAGTIAAESMKVAASELEEAGAQDLGRLAEGLAQLRNEVRRCVSYISEARAKLSHAA